MIMMKFNKWPLHKFRLLSLGLIVAICLTSLPAYSQIPNQTALKARFVGIFLSYIQAGPSGKTICVSGDSKILEALKVSAKKANVVAISSSDLSSCSMVFIGKSPASSASELIRKADAKSIVSISDRPDFLNQGGLVELYEKEGKIKFGINLKKSKVVGVKFDSKVVELADKTI